jgi:hypothetical protein
MASTFVVSRSQLIYALCLPLAVLIGYFLAEPLESGSIAIIVLVLCVLCLPILMKWYHPMVIMSWNMVVTAIGLPGRPGIWIVMAALGFLIAVLNRSVNAHRRFINVPALTKPLIFILGVVLITAALNGGIGLNALGAVRAGGKGYFFIFAAIAGYFAMTSQRIPPERAGFYVALFFLPGLTALVAHAASMLGAKSEILFLIFPGTPGELTRASQASVFLSDTRYGELAVAAPALYGYLLARCGVRGLLNFHSPWRTLLFLLAVLGCVYCGYRSALVLLMLSFVAVFYWEGLHRTRILPALAGILLLVATLMLTQAQKLPYAAQRTLSFLPVKIDSVVRESAESSTEWRVEMWKSILPDVPRYLLKGKGYRLTADDMYWASQNAGLNANEGGSAVAGDYHNGPLSTVIPFGIWGMIGFTWLIVAGFRYLYNNYRQGNPALRQINTLLLALFAAKVFFFLVVFGSFFADLYAFTGILGLAVSLNGAPGPRIVVEAPEEALSSASLRV